MATPFANLPVEVRNTIEETLDWFDAEKASRVFQFLNWKWATSEINGDGVPHAVEIRRTARELAAGAYASCEKGGRCTHATGGLSVTCFKEDDCEFTVEFIAVSS